MRSAGCPGRRGSGGLCGASAALAGILLLAGCGGNGSEGEGRLARSSDPPVASVDAPDFDGERAWELLRRQVEFGPRVPGSPGHAAQLEWMAEYLEERADTVIRLPFEHRTREGESIAMTNVFARFRPQASERILLVAHWDTRPTADEESDPERRARPIPGANDGASGTAVLLELADVLSRHSAPLGVDLLLVDGEDWRPGEMYLGSRHFAANLPPGYAPLYGIVVDMVGDTDPRFPIEANSWQLAPEVVDRLWRTAEALGYGHIFPRTAGIPIDDDHIPLNRAGIRTALVIDFEYGPRNRHWHTLSDHLSNTSSTGLEAVGSVLTQLIYSGG